MSERIPVFKPYIGVDASKAAVDALDLGWLAMGSYVRDFEERVKATLECTDRHVVSVNTGTSALHLAMLTLGIGPGDEAITPSFDNIGDFRAIRAAGGEPVACDIDEHTLGIDVAEAEALPLDYRQDGDKGCWMERTEPTGRSSRYLPYMEQAA